MGGIRAYGRYYAEYLIFSTLCITFHYLYRYYTFHIYYTRSHKRSRKAGIWSINRYTSWHKFKFNYDVNHTLHAYLIKLLIVYKWVFASEHAKTN
ncbi:hypothetical protein BC03BB108_B0085 (plasmid) [Bacillus cereus 03BB108]|nr:hypothetical protein BC03BB108_B0085 [Bacillus cereus 03BB108]